MAQCWTLAECTELMRVTMYLVISVINHHNRTCIYSLLLDLIASDTSDVSPIRHYILNERQKRTKNSVKQTNSVKDRYKNTFLYSCAKPNTGSFGPFSVSCFHSAKQTWTCLLLYIWKTVFILKIFWSMSICKYILKI